MMGEFSSYRIIDLLESGASSFVNGEIKNFSSTYKPASGSTPAQKNDDVESFLKKKAETFSRQNLSMTHLVLSSVNQEFFDGLGLVAGDEATGRTTFICALFLFRSKIEKRGLLDAGREMPAGSLARPREKFGNSEFT